MHVTDASWEFATGSQALSERTELAAAGLQRTVGSLVDVGEAAKHSASLGAQADEFARKASATAVDAQSATALLASSMPRIEDSAKRIADITQIIDKIAFHTNVLALNASVEAAHGGKRGSGFSVVAQKMRNLAQQCAGAASEIRGLIDEANNRIRDGVVQSDKAKAAMQQTTDAISRVCGFIRQGAKVTHSQTVALGQVAQALDALDSKGQRDAALVEECVAAIDSVFAEIDSLRQSAADQ